MPILALLPEVAPPRPPVVVPPKWFRLAMTWTGWDGVEWTLTDPSGARGVFLTQDGITGLEKTEETAYTSASPALPGSMYRGFHADERDVIWPLFLFSDVSSADWLDLDRAWWRSLRSGMPGVWRVTTPDGRSRSLVCRFADVDRSMDRDPHYFGWRRYGISLKAYQPYWQGEPVVRSFVNEQSVPFFGGPGEPGAPPFFISSGSTLATASIDNPGDVDASPVFVLDGPWDSGVSVGVGAAQTVYNAAIPAGSAVVVDTRPEMSGRNVRMIPSPTADVGSDDWLGQVDADGTDKFTSVNPVAVGVTVPAGTPAPLAISAAGAGLIHVVVRPSFERAW